VKTLDAEICNKMQNLSQMSACWKLMVWKSFQNNMELLDARKQVMEVLLDWTSKRPVIDREYIVQLKS
jgi:hypothetical protein